MRDNDEGRRGGKHGMNTPVYDFVKSYASGGTARMHVPGHKGTGPIGAEALDLTEIDGADSLYAANGIIAESENNAANIFGTGRTLYSAEGSSQCVKAMLFLACAQNGGKILAARNVHSSFVSAAALLDLEVEWLWGEERSSVCSCRVSAEELEEKLKTMARPPAAVYITSPDYLGGMADIAALSKVCHRHKTSLIVDNAHGAYLRFLEKDCHPITLGADMCCDSAHKTLPVLTGGAYLHINKNAPERFFKDAKKAMAIFGSTSPSYLILASMDFCNKRLCEDYPGLLRELCLRLEKLRERLCYNGWRCEKSDPMRIVIRAPGGLGGPDVAGLLRRGGVECEFADRDCVVLMPTPQNREEDLERIVKALGENSRPYLSAGELKLSRPERACSIREAVFGESEPVSAEKSLGRICAAPTVSCPPAVPVVVSGEIIDESAVEAFKAYGIKTVEVTPEKTADSKA